MKPNVKVRKARGATNGKVRMSVPLDPHTHNLVKAVAALQGQDSGSWAAQALNDAAHAAMASYQTTVKVIR